MQRHTYVAKRSSSGPLRTQNAAPHFQKVIDCYNVSMIRGMFEETKHTN